MKFRIYSMLLAVGLLAILVGTTPAQDNTPDILANIPVFRADDGGFTMGDPDAPVTIIEFADYLCGHCQTHHATVRAFIEQFVATGQAKFQYRFMPIIDDHYSPLMSAVTECAAEQGAFWRAHDLMFDVAQNNTRAIVGNLAEFTATQLELDQDALETCVGGLGTESFQYEIDYQLGVALGVTGTPATRVQIGNDGAIGAIRLNNVTYSRGGAPIEILTAFVNSENPESLVKLLNQLRDSSFLPDTSLITGDPCGAPCWNGIAVGETTWDDAIAILEETESITNLQYREAQEGTAKQAIWSAVGGEPCCYIITMDGETVGFLWLQLAPQMTLSEVIERYGEPAYVTGQIHTPDQAYLVLFFPDHFLAVSAFVAGAESGVLSEDSEIISLEYFDETEQESILSGTPLHTWEGYLSYRDYMDGAFEINSGEPEA